MTRRAFIAAAALAVLAAACGPGDRVDVPVAGARVAAASPGPATAPGVRIVARDIAFDAVDVSVAAGEPVTIVFDNRDVGISHNLHVTGPSVDAQTAIAPGPVEQRLTLDLDGGGAYAFVCDVHPDQMRGTITVE